MVTIENYSERHIHFLRPPSAEDKDKGVDLAKRQITFPRSTVEPGENGNAARKPGITEVSDEVFAEMKSDRVSRSWFAPGVLVVRDQAASAAPAPEGKRRQ
jgi:hypothetical protein